MSFMAGRLAATEGAFFKQTSKAAALRLKQKLESQGSLTVSQSSETVASTEDFADALPEILRHCDLNVPEHSELSISANQIALKAVPPAPSALANSIAFKQPNLLEPVVYRKQIGTLTDFLVSVPQATLGPRRWNVEVLPQPTLVPSTANDAAVCSDPISNAVNAKEVEEGYFMVAKAFAIATGLVFGGAAIVITAASLHFQLHSVDDLRTKMKGMMKPKVEAIRHSLKPVHDWSQSKMKVDEVHGNSIAKS